MARRARVSTGGKSMSPNPRTKSRTGRIDALALSPSDGRGVVSMVHARLPLIPIRPARSGAVSPLRHCHHHDSLYRLVCRNFIVNSCLTGGYFVVMAASNAFCRRTATLCVIRLDLAAKFQFRVILPARRLRRYGCSVVISPHRCHYLMLQA